MSWFSRHYNHWAVLRPWPLLIALLLVLMVLGWHARDFRLDASADSLLLENDQDYKVFRDLSERYQSKSFLVVALVPEQGVFSASTLKRVDQLALDLEEVSGISSVVSLLDVPLLAQGEGSLTELAGNYRTLRDSEVDLDKARDELTTSPVFSELIVSADGRTTALQLNLDEAPEFDALQGERRRLSQRIGAGKADILQPLFLDITGSSLRVGIVGIPPVNDDIARLKHGNQLIDNRVDGRARFDQHHDLARRRQVVNHFLQRMAADKIPSGSTSLDEFVHLFGGPVVDSHPVTAALHIESQVFAHHCQADQTKVTFFAHGSLFVN